LKQPNFDQIWNELQDRIKIPSDSSEKIESIFKKLELQEDQLNGLEANLKSHDHSNKSEPDFDQIWTGLQSKIKDMIPDHGNTVNEIQGKFSELDKRVSDVEGIKNDIKTNKEEIKRLQEECKIDPIDPEKLWPKVEGKVKSIIPNCDNKIAPLE
jgi:chromosome segregation ATPase